MKVKNTEILKKNPVECSCFLLFETGKKRNRTDKFFVGDNSCGIFFVHFLQSKNYFFHRMLVFQGNQMFFQKWFRFQKKTWKTLDKNKKKEYNTDKNKNKHRKRGFDYGYDE